MRAKKALVNSITSLTLQAVTIICGFILPRIMLTAFGSEVNGAVASISQFLGYISLLEAGSGGVARAALYAPLANRDYTGISAVYNATQLFFRKLAFIFLAYSAVLSFLFKFISGTELSVIYTGSLVLIISVSTFCQYYFGIVNSLLVTADQRGYISTSIQIGTVILNAVLSVIIVRLGFGIHVVKLLSTGVYLIRPLVLDIFVRRYYHIDRNVPPDMLSIRQRWNGLGHHISYFLHCNVDIMVTTVFLGLKWVSVYYVYDMIANGITGLVTSLTGGLEATFGNMIAKGEKETLLSRFRMVETATSLVVVILFSTAGVLILDFVMIYTSGVTDINYYMPVFGVSLVMSQALHCLRQSYHYVVIAAGHYKETQNGAFTEAGINIVLSLLLVKRFGLSGIIAATIVATVFMILYYVFYLQRHILQRDVRLFFKRAAVNLLNVLLIVMLAVFIPLPVPTNYFEWTVKALGVFTVVCTITFGINLAFFKDDIAAFFRILTGVLRKSA